MRVETYLVNPDHPAPYTRREVMQLAPWAGVIQRVEGGFTAFESEEDYQTWRAQQ